MPRNFRAALVRRGHRGSQLGRGNEHISLEIVYAFVQPVIDSLGSIFRPGELVQLQSPRTRTLQMWAGDVNLWAWHSPSVNLLLDLQIGVRFQGTGGADRSHASRKIKPGKTETHLSEDHIPHGIKHVVMHADEAGNHAVAVQVEQLGFTRYPYRRGISDSRDFSFEYHDGLVLARTCAGAINDAYMSQSHKRSIYFYEIAHLRR